MDSVLLSLLLTIASVSGQLDADVLQPVYDFENENGQFFEDEEGLLKDYLPPPSPREQRFLDGLIVEAGRHVLMPELYATPREEEPRLVELGQPEIEESYLNQKSRRSGLNCPDHCSVYKPVCGSDGKVYESECHMRKENCGVSDVTSGPWQKCRGRHYLCPSRCLDLNDPVCGSDGRIYHNMCVFRRRNCGKLLETQPVQRCYENFRQSKDLRDCPEECQEVYRPACGSDGVIYYNECFLRKRTCNSGIVEMSMESCVEIPKCPEICLPLYDPVCGSDRRLYINHCRMLQENCGNDIKVISKSNCVEAPSRIVTAVRHA